jgi:hypothetical protein
MLKNPLEEKVNEWSKTDNSIREINHKIIHLEKRLFCDYLPCQPPSPQFFIRLKKWIENVSSKDDEKILFQMIPEIFYVGSVEFDSLYRTAYNSEVAKWLIECLGLKCDDPNAEINLKNAAAETWFCAATDSFRINDFFKINNVPCRYDFRPDWHSLTKLGDISTIQQYVKGHGIQRVVILEDFVGSGSQVEGAIKFLCSTLPDTDVLVISLISCPNGITNFANLRAIFPRLAVKHIVELKESMFIADTHHPDEIEFHTKTREMVIRLYPITTDGKTSPLKKPYTPLGYKKTGALVVLYSNTPDNTLPVIHWESKKWYPLFKRITRV